MGVHGTGHNDQPATQRPAIAVISSAYPVQSETFVHREVRGLRQRSWPVTTVSLHDPPMPAEQVLGPDEPQSIVVYGKSLLRTLLAAIRETLTHPRRAANTFMTACHEALQSTDARSTRLRIMPQAIAALGLANQLRRKHVAMVHCHFAHAPATVGMYAALQLGVPFSFVGHANDLYQRRALLKTKLYRAAFVSCISRTHLQLYQNLLPRDEADYPIIRCGVDTNEFSAAPSSEDGNLQLLTVCRLVEKKGIDTLIRALALLRESDPTWELTIAGFGPQEQQLRQLASDLHLHDAITWTGPVKTAQVRQLMQDAHVFVLPCREDSRGDRDGIPVVLMEAMASGLPVITGDIPSIHDLVQHKKSGLLVPGNDPVAVAHAAKTLRDDDQLRRKLAHAGRQHVVDEFSQAVNLDRLEQALLRAIDGPCSAAPPPSMTESSHKTNQPGPRETTIKGHAVARR